VKHGLDMTATHGEKEQKRNLKKKQSKQARIGSFNNPVGYWRAKEVCLLGVLGEADTGMFKSHYMMRKFVKLVRKKYWKFKETCETDFFIRFY
jgi:hypothetical protein